MALNSKQQMKPYHKNPRRINKKQFEQLKENLLYLGDLSGIVHDLNSNEIIGGNQRSSVFDVNECDVEIVHQYDYPDEQGTIAHGFIIWKDKRYTYRQVRWTPKQCEQANITANRLGGEWDFDELANWDMSDLLTWGFEESDFPFDVAPATNEGADAEPQIDKAEELRVKWDVQSGQMWQLGEHRIICGDCTDKAVVDRVMGGEKARLCLTDPPYGLGEKKESGKNDYDQYNDTQENLVLLAKKWLPVARSLCGSVVFSPGVTNAWLYPPADWVMCWFYGGGQLRSSWGFNCWQPFLCYGKDPSLATGNGGRPDAVNLNTPANSGDLDHPCPKPIALWEWFINRLSFGEYDVLYEPFSGSGTTIIACENLSRKCRAVEISPAYVAVAIQRWVDVTGKEPILLDA